MNEEPPATTSYFPLIRMLLVGAFAFIALAAVVMVLLAQVLAGLQTTLDDFDADAYRSIEILMGAPLPAGVRDIDYVQGLNFTTARFSVPPQAYTVFIARARPVIEAGCWILPLQPEGSQAKKPGCGAKNMIISIDKHNPALWRVMIDIR
jgi:hypothetical protein